MRASGRVSGPVGRVGMVGLVVAGLLLAGCTGGSDASTDGAGATPGTASGSAGVTSGSPGSDSSSGATGITTTPGAGPSTSGTAPTTGPAASGSAAGGSASGGRPPGTSRPPGWWRPARGMTWQWQLSGPLDLSVPVQVYDVDLFDTSAQQVAALHARGRKVICYLNAGAYEPRRPDSARFPKAVLGNAMDGWPDERWLDVRRLDLLQPLLGARLDLCRAKGFDGVEPDNVDGYANDSGFPLSAADQLRFNRWLADAAHARGLAVGLKNDLEQVAALQPVFDFAVNEECMQYDECTMLSAFVRAGKPVLHVEYDLTPGSFCPTARRLGFSSMRKNLDLDVPRTAC